MKFKKEHLKLWGYPNEYLIQILNGEYSVEDAQQDLISLIIEDDITNPKEVDL